MRKSGPAVHNPKVKGAKSLCMGGLYDRDCLIKFGLRVIETHKKEFVRRKVKTHSCAQVRDAVFFQNRGRWQKVQSLRSAGHSVFSCVSRRRGGPSTQKTFAPFGVSECSNFRTLNARTARSRRVVN